VVFTPPLPDPHLSPMNNAVCITVQGAGIGHVDTVLVDGRLRKWRGSLVGVDFASVRRSAERSRDHLLSAVRWPLDATDLTD